jgi:hypothetical protein
MSKNGISGVLTALIANKVCPNRYYQSIRQTLLASYSYRGILRHLCPSAFQPDSGDRGAYCVWKPSCQAGDARSIFIRIYCGVGVRGTLLKLKTTKCEPFQR